MSTRQPVQIALLIRHDILILSLLASTHAFVTKDSANLLHVSTMRLVAS